MPGTTYYVRTYATNNVGTAYGEERTITTFPANSCGGITVTDYDGNIYHTVPIGQQCWMRENLRTTHFTDGTEIALGGSSASLTTPYRYIPHGFEWDIPMYGYLYNWVAAMHGDSSSNTNPSGVQGICPTGWHVPSESEWTQLTNYVSSQSQYFCNNNSNDIAKALASTKAWHYSGNECAVGNEPRANNATGFSALPADGYVDHPGANLWSSTQTIVNSNSRNAIYLKLVNSESIVLTQNSLGGDGFSVRCLRD